MGFFLHCKTVNSSNYILIFAADYAGMMRGLYPGGQGGGGGRSYPHHGMSSYHQHNLHRYNQVGKYNQFFFHFLYVPFDF